MMTKIHKGNNNTRRVISNSYQFNNVICVIILH